MADPAKTRFSCPSCPKKYKWKPALAGKTIRCKGCGQKMRIRSRPGGTAKAIGPAPSPEASTYELELDEEAAPAEEAAYEAVDGKCPACNAALKPNAVICINCGFNLHVGKRLRTTVSQDAGDQPKAGPGPTAAPAGQRKLHGSNDISQFAGLAASAGKTNLAAALSGDTEEQHHFWERILPLIIAGSGLGLALANAFLLAPLVEVELITKSWGLTGSTSGESLNLALYSLAKRGIWLVVQLPILLVGIFVVAKIFSTSFGTLGAAVLKLLAIALMTGAVNDSVYIGLNVLTGGFGDLAIFIELLIMFAVFVALCMWLLEMDVMEAGVMYLLVIGGPTLAMIYLLPLIAMML